VEPVALECNTDCASLGHIETFSTRIDSSGATIDSSGGTPDCSRATIDAKLSTPDMNAAALYRGVTIVIRSCESCGPRSNSATGVDKPDGALEYLVAAGANAGDRWSNEHVGL
jgi:glycine/D-amino acid oxidase-like deaminating enzyme